ncbi:MAG: DNA-binding protein WhiA [Oscillospiraceae bacterium]|jgi:DNA-binding protein WhiA|nr:DNA-binding protein WhiA [Oscillospiraceae bacterium]
MNIPISNVNFSFSSRVKEELASVPYGAACCVTAEMSALMYTTSTLSIDADNELTLRMNSRGMCAVNRARALAHVLLDDASDVSTLASPCATGICMSAGAADQPDLNPGEAVWVGDRARSLLNVCGLLGDQGWFAVSDVERPSANAKSCCRAAFLRGSFLGGGSAADPAKEYHLEFVSSDERLAVIWVELLEGLKLTPRSVWRKNQRVVYLKEAEQIALLLTVMRASASRLYVEDARILKGMRNQVNRATNCDSANLDKAVDAADRHVRAIKAVARVAGLGSLPDVLRETAEARLDHPELPLAELGRMLTPAVGKSGMNHRLRKIERLAESLAKSGGLGRPPDRAIDIDIHESHKISHE